MLVPIVYKFKLSHLFSGIFICCFSFFYGFFLQLLPFWAFKDRINYLRYAESSDEILSRFILQGPLATLANEPLWLLSNIGLSQYFQPEIAVRIIIFTSALILSYVLLKASDKRLGWMALFLLFMPGLLKNYIVHLRQGLAIALFFWGYYSKRRIIHYLLMFASPFIHASYALILPLILLFRLLKKAHLALDVRFLSCVAYIVSICCFLNFFAHFLGARQADNYNFSMASGLSGLGPLFWLVILSVLLSQGLEYIRKNEVSIGFLIFYFISYFSIEVTGRIFTSAMPMILISGLNLFGWRRWGFIFLILSFALIQWYKNFFVSPLFIC